MDKKKRGWGIYWLVAVLAVAFICIGVANCKGAITDAIDATCRISAEGGARGTGCAFERSGGRVFVLTCAHVVGGSRTVQCEFWNRGHQSRPITGAVVARASAADSAVVMIPEQSFGGILPSIVPLAKTDTQQPGALLTSVGCAGGGWSTAWKGHVRGYVREELRFYPPPANGRSGSAVFNADATQIVGLLRARTGDDSQGIATNVRSIRNALTRKVMANKRNQQKKVQCEGGVCPAGPFTPGSPEYRYYLLPGPQYRQYQRGKQQQPQPSPIYPTLPPVAPAPSIDMGPTNDRLDKIGELLMEMKRDREMDKERAKMQVEKETRPVVPVPPPPDTSAADKAAAEATAAADAAKAEAVAAKEEVKVSTEKVSALRAAVEKLIGDRETLRDRFDARIEKVKADLGEDASRREVAAAYVKDLAKEKLGSGAAGLTAGKILGGALGMSGPLALTLGGGLWLLSRRIGGKVEAGEPLLIQRFFDRISNEVDGLKERISDKAAPPPQVIVVGGQPPPAAEAVPPATET